MIAISKNEAKFIQTCFKKNRYFLTNDSLCQYFPDLSEKALYQMVYRLKKKELLYSMMNGQYLVRPIKEWLDGKLEEKTFLKGLLSCISSMGGVLSGSSAFFFIKNKKLPKDNWEVTTPEPATRTKTLKAELHKKKIKFKYNKKIYTNIDLYRIDDLMNGTLGEPEKMTENQIIPDGYFAVESIDAFL
jgi:predicted transcriptional regulator of viral defense system